jgi:alkaline phosphatase D
MPPGSSKAWKNRWAAILLLASPAWADPVLMLGHVAPDAARVWCQDETGAPTSALFHCAGEVLPGVLTRVDDQICIADVAGLKPDQDVRADLGSASLRFRTPAPPTSTGRIVVALGSCDTLADPAQHSPLFQTLAELRPDAMLWLGDNWYLLNDTGGTHAQIRETGALLKGEWTETARARGRALATRRHPDLRALLGATAHYATWDDHDYGFNNAPFGDPPDLTPEQQRAVWFGRAGAQQVFEALWANGPERGPGISSSFRRGPAVFFLMDDRSFKDVPARTIWGGDQMAWLQRGLKAAEAAGVPLKVIANGTQVLPPVGVESHQTDAPGERADLLAWLDRERIGGVVFVSGDRHRAELWYFEGQSASLELTASPLHHGYQRDPGPPQATRRWVGPKANSFGLLTFEAQSGGRGTLVLEARDAAGAPLPDAHRGDGSVCVSRFDLEAGRFRPR